MIRNLLLASLGIVLAAAGASPTRASVLVELFTSEGCSSCPPADRLLEKLDPNVIVLSEHVDYWNHQGWTDPYSSPIFSERQRDYGRQFNLDSVYTPQMVVDGSAQFNGSDVRRAAREVADAAGRRKSTLHISRNGAELRVEVDEAIGSADVFMALTQPSGDSRVSGGENRGRRLHHVSIVRSLRKIGSVNRGGVFSRIVRLPGSASAQRVVVFLQQSGGGRISGAAMLPPDPS